MAPAPAAVPPPNISTEPEMIATLTHPLRGGETSFHGNARREAELAAQFDRLTALEAFHLHKRLANPRAGDALAAAFGRMIGERRERLLAYLRDTRRREAQRAARAH